jgi:hypothetical protein
MKIKVLIVAVLACGPALAGLVQLSPASVADGALTNYLDFDSLGTGQNVTSVTGDGLTVDLSTTMETEWAGPSLNDYFTWNEYPDSMLTSTSATMMALGNSTATSITLTLSEPVWGFGVEVSPADDTNGTVTGTFYSPTDVGTSFTVSGLSWVNNACFSQFMAGQASDCVGGSQIIAASGGPIQSVTISLNPTDQFELAGIVFETEPPAPEPSTFLLLGTALLGLGVLSRRRLAR